MVENHVGLKAFASLNPWFPSLVAGMLDNRLNDRHTITTKLGNLTKREATLIGKSLSMALNDRLVAEAGVDQWLNEYGALVTLSKENIFFVPMSVAISNRKLVQAVWGLALSVGVGVVMSYLDVGTDIWAIIMFERRGQHQYAQAIVIMIGVSTILHMLIVYENGRKSGKMHLLRETLLVVSQLKPAVDAFHVVSGTKASEHAAMDPQLELTLGKISEVICETIPSAVVQLYAFFQSETVNFSSLASIVVSVATIANIVTVMAFDFDLNPAARAHTPKFYGYIPNRLMKRMMVFGTMFAFSAFHVSVRFIGVTILAIARPYLVGVFVGGDMLCFLLFKLVRDDLRYWIKLPNFASWPISIIARLLNKLLVDFTALVHLRHPNEAGE